LEIDIGTGLYSGRKRRKGREDDAQRG